MSQSRKKSNLITGVDLNLFNEGSNEEASKNEMSFIKGEAKTIDLSVKVFKDAEEKDEAEK